MMTAHRLILTLACVSTLGFGQRALGQADEAEPPKPASTLQLDVEIDPIAYALRGHSVHVGLRTGHFRFDIGAFGLEMPTAFHGNEGYDAAFSGVGVKADWALRADGSGPFAGVEGSYSTLMVSTAGSQQWVRAPQGNAGGRVGWRIPLYRGLYIAPWVGVGANFGAKSIAVEAETFEVNPIYVFPTVHVGYVGG